MELSEVKQLTHKIIKIDIENKNFYSLHNYITQKITITDVSDEEVIRFSLEENSNFIQHQSDNDDYYIIIPNNLNSITSIYVHYFPAELYEYEEDQNIFSKFTFSSLLEENPTDEFGYVYPIIESGNGYTKERGNKPGSIQLKSTLNNKGTTEYKDPNYKEVTDTNINDKKDMTEQGYFPLSSRYRPPYKYFNNSPDMENNPKWTAQEVHDTVCQQSPYWQIRLHRSGLSPLIAETSDNEYYPIAVHLNYQYLPTSTYYHQHYYGFEGECPQKDDMFVFEGTNIRDVNENFGPKDNYRIIKRTNPFDYSHSMFVDHECIRPLELLDCSPKEYITKNKCYNYYTYTAVGDETPSLTMQLQEGEQYSLRYFIYVPNNVDIFTQEYNNIAIRNKELTLEELATEDIYTKQGSITIDNNGFYFGKNAFGFLKKGWYNDSWTLTYSVTEGGYTQIPDEYVYIVPEGTTSLNNYISLDRHGKIRCYINKQKVYENTYATQMHIGNGTWPHITKISKQGNQYKVTYTRYYDWDFNDVRHQDILEFTYDGFNDIDCLSLGAESVSYGWHSQIRITNVNIDNKYEKYVEDPIIYDCYLAVNGEMISDKFLQYDKNNRNGWVYHEIPFISQGKDKIEIIGPKNNPNIQFFLTKVELEKFLEYSPRLDYNEYGLTITENEVKDNFCANNRIHTNGSKLRVPDDTIDEEWQLIPATNVWKQKDTLPNPTGKIFFTLGNDVDIIYDELTTSLYYSHPNDYPYELKYYPTTKDGHEEGTLVQHNWDENINLYYDEESGSLFATYPRTVRFYKGPNNKFDLYLSDINDIPINRGNVEVTFANTNYKDDEGLVYTGKRKVQNDGFVHYRKVNLSSLELVDNKPTKFWMKIKYTDPCLDEPIYDFKIVWVEPINLDLKLTINGNDKNKRFIAYKDDGTPIYGQDCVKYKESEYYHDDEGTEITYTNFETHAPLIDQDTHQQYYGGVWSHYDILDKTFFKGTKIKRGGYFVYDVELEFPLNIRVQVVDKLSSGEESEFGDGYCELSIDDKIIQTTIVDGNGYADFFIDLHDFPLNKHTIKIAYYNEYWNVLKYIYFDLIVCEDTTKIRPAVPLIFKEFPYCPWYAKTDDTTQCTFFYLNDDNFETYIPQDDCLILDFDNNQEHSYKLSIYRHKPQYKNISKFTDRNSKLIYTKNVYSEEDLSVIVATGMLLDRYSELSRNQTEDNHPALTGPTEKEQISNLMDKIITHGINTQNSIQSSLKNDIYYIKTLEMYPETICDFMLYAPITNVTSNPTQVKFADYYRNNVLQTPVRYSIVTSSLDGETRWRTHKRSFTVNYMNYIPAQNYEIYWEGKSNGEPFYNDDNEDGYWEFKPLQIRQTTQYQKNNIYHVDNENDYINEGKIEVYQNGKIYYSEFIVNGVCNIIPRQKEAANDTIQIRYLFKDGYHYLSN